ncbi:hypothetical protein XI09_14465 [Bradyrhizobium sp. CCBAU 11386]|uniref:hypothetical protein n=1 Tax=unclassified Bradyrhizobium TaxID=2631580 RepID=UPI002304C700|nr:MULTISPECIES: hypothetical protein [unclassified Bradyrhizobium]MDA9495135.1 hypothetical protein [Bradyrhizobium sp. CCBAU 11361]MDA9505818.1 hypothetical protein [Bradyrhizobium sp. CCBAU 11386]
MLALGLALNAIGVGLLCWLIFAIAVYALPFFVAMNIGMTAFRGGAGVVGALLVGIASGAFTVVLSQVTLAASRSLTLRIVIAVAFTAPAAVAGYQVAFAVSHIGVPSPGWREVFACVGAVSACCTAWGRLNALAETRPFEPAGEVKHSQPVLTATMPKR